MQVFSRKFLEKKNIINSFKGGHLIIEWGSIKTENSSRYGPIELMRSTSGCPLSTIPSMYMRERIIGNASSPKEHPASTAALTVFIICSVRDTSLTEVPHEFVLLRALAECEVKPSVRLLSNRIGFAMGKVSKLITILRKEAALVGDSYILNERGKCMLHEWFPQAYPEPDSYKEFQSEIPF